MRHLSIALAGSALLAFAGCKIETDLIPERADPRVSVPPEPENPVQIDRIVQVTEPVVDILFVVDNSSSMGDEQFILQQNFPSFVDYFTNSGLDYHIGMVSTDVQRADHQGKLRTGFGYRFIDNFTENPAQVFSQMTQQLGVLSGSEESGRAAAYYALEINRDSPRNEGFLRDEGELHIIFVSDTFDNSSANPVTIPEFLQWAAGLKARPGLVTMHAIVAQVADPACVGSFRPGTQYLQYAAATNGITYSICETDWEPALDALGLQTSGLKQEFFLSRIPVTEPDLLLDILVTFVGENDQEITVGFEVCMPETQTETCRVLYQRGRNSITFLDYTPDPMAEVLATYYIAENYAAGTVEEALD
ncbi:MAG: VWA domain-containing protein [Alphaproteobacteria bacterium]|nr:VWA domain-containing protein [Alphaproteobacteria bacterium]